MKTLATKALSFVILGALVYWMFTRDQHGVVTDTMVRGLAPAQRFYAAHPVWTVVLFCILHLTGSALSLPGSCTTLNTISGAVFGFWRGCAIVYPITLVSAALTYRLGARFRGHRWLSRYAQQIEMLRSHLARRDYLFLVSLRLNPLLPFGVLNVLLGLLHVPFAIYALTTVVGIFFDVTLLNNLGAGLGPTATLQSQRDLALSFLGLMSVFFLLRLLLPKAYTDNSQAGGVNAA
jgi:uncharacterized membrane protein YdjX (TVP38/TMEM64 family)